MKIDKAMAVENLVGLRRIETELQRFGAKEVDKAALQHGIVTAEIRLQLLEANEAIERCEKANGDLDAASKAKKILEDRLAEHQHFASTEKGRQKLIMSSQTKYQASGQGGRRWKQQRQTNAARFQCLAEHGCQNHEPTRQKSFLVIAQRRRKPKRSTPSDSNGNSSKSDSAESRSSESSQSYSYSSASTSPSRLENCKKNAKPGKVANRKGKHRAKADSPTEKQQNSAGVGKALAEHERCAFTKEGRRKLRIPSRTTNQASSNHRQGVKRQRQRATARSRCPENHDCKNRKLNTEGSSSVLTQRGREKSASSDNFRDSSNSSSAESSYSYSYSSASTSPPRSKDCERNVKPGSAAENKGKGGTQANSVTKKQENGAGVAETCANGCSPSKGNCERSGSIGSQMLAMGSQEKKKAQRKKSGSPKIATTVASPAFEISQENNMAALDNNIASSCTEQLAAMLLQLLKTGARLQRTPTAVIRYEEDTEGQMKELASVKIEKQEVDL